MDQECQVLVVEDDNQVRRYIALMLKSFGYTVKDVADGPQAIQAMDVAANFDILLTDMVLPNGIGGDGVALAFKRKFPDGKVIYSSGFVDQSIVESHCLPDGVGFLVKPYGPETLIETMDRMLHT